ncbi:hypothetical protein KY284_035569 [Solanum tuberosum]|nr:hypothetical protein KY284_035569 [Solanum tuberosum]
MKVNRECDEVNRKYCAVSGGRGKKGGPGDESSSTPQPLRSRRAMSLLAVAQPSIEATSADCDSTRPSFFDEGIHASIGNPKKGVIPVRLHFCETIPQARQPISHRRVCVNNGMVNITHFKLSHGDIISFQENDARTRGEEIKRSFYIEISVEKIIGKFLDHPWRRTKLGPPEARSTPSLCVIARYLAGKDGPEASSLPASKTRSPLLSVRLPYQVTRRKQLRARRSSISTVDAIEALNAISGGEDIPAAELLEAVAPFVTGLQETLSGRQGLAGIFRSSGQDQFRLRS